MFARLESLGTVGQRIGSLLLTALWLAAASPASAASSADEKLDTLTAGTQTYTKVTVLNKTRTDVFISHSKGMCSVKVKDLDIATQLKLGYQVEQPKPSKIKEVEKILQAPDLQNLEQDPRMQKLDAETAAWITQFVKQLDVVAIYSILAGVFLLYMLFCFLSRCICMKTAAPPTRLIPLIWFPFVQQIPLLVAAGMSPWWILTTFVPPLAIIPGVMWCFKIVQARGKHVIFAVMLLFPFFSIVSFVYLALSRGCGEEDPSDSGVITLQSSPRKEAA